MFNSDYGRRVRQASTSAASSSSLQASTSSYSIETRPTTAASGPSQPPIPEDVFGSILSSPKSTRKGKERVYSDRFIPARDLREGANDLSTSFQLLEVPHPAPETPSRGSKRKIERGPENDSQKEEAKKTFNALLKSELFGPNITDGSSPDISYLTTSPSTSRYQSGSGSNSSSINSTTPTRNLFSYSSPVRKRVNTGGPQGLESPTHDRYGVSPVRYESSKLLLSPRKTPRSVSKVPFKVLDAPELADDFYLNLVDWSWNNVLAVGLGSCVYLWSAYTSHVTKLCDLAPNDSITSLAWIERGSSSLAVGTNSGLVQIYNAEDCKHLRTMSGHSQRVGSLAWNEHVLSSGSKDRSILHRDVRIREHHIRKLTGHKQEICGLKWNASENQLASGGNDNKLFIWEGLNEAPLHRFSDHTAAVKAIAWNPHQHGILASGGGTADKKLRFWNTLTGVQISEVDTGSQVCNLLWSKNSSELVSTHGFSTGQVQNQVCIWRYPSLTQVATLTGHSYRVLYLACSPDGQTIVTGAGDETLRFWHAFPKVKSEKKGESSSLNPFAKVR